ncbi:hypothetical protein ACFWGP_05370 [Agromyces sp. NPDC127015]|uniref:hypothetical protein n=1 Tax=Agromyces sp. NPDC127015 TaxID=3347108 RepID=UPI00366640DB
MSVWNRPAHVVKVQLMRVEQDGRGAFRDVPDGGLIDVPCTVQSAREWSTAEENLLNGLQVLDLCRIFAKVWPGDVRSLVYHDGAEWETVGSPQHFDVSPRTDHWVVTLRKRGDVG